MLREGFTDTAVMCQGTRRQENRAEVRKLEMQANKKFRKAAKEEQATRELGLIKGDRKDFHKQR